MPGPLVATEWCAIIEAMLPLVAFFQQGHSPAVFEFRHVQSWQIQSGCHFVPYMHVISHTTEQPSVVHKSVTVTADDSRQSRSGRSVATSIYHNVAAMLWWVATAHTAQQPAITA